MGHPITNAWSHLCSRLVRNFLITNFILNHSPAVGGIGVMYECVVLPVAQNTYRSPETPWVFLMSSTIITNLYCTGMISYSIWSSQRQLSSSQLGNMGVRMRVSCSKLSRMSNPYTTLNFQRTLHILVESAALLTVCLSFFICTC